MEEGLNSVRSKLAKLEQLEASASARTDVKPHLVYSQSVQVCINSKLQSTGRFN